jgi:methionyl-tRNA formyltransferase
LKFGFVTCVQLGLECMEAIYDVGGGLDLIVTLSDDIYVDKSGRVFLDDFCQQRGVRLIKIRNINSEEVIREITNAGIDWLFIIGWSQIARKELLDSPMKGVLGIHPTLLPQGRGRAPIPWAIIKGLKKTGVTLFKLDEGVDTGPILAQKEIYIEKEENAGTLYEKARLAHGELIREIWLDLINDRINPIDQKETDASLWPGRTHKDGEIFFNMSLEQVDRLVRGVTHPYPGAFIKIDDSIYRIWSGHISAHGPGKGNFKISDSGVLTIGFEDGGYIATNWDRCL